MTAMQLNAEILRNLGTLAEDENMLKRVAKYLRKLVEEKEADPVRSSWPSSTRARMNIVKANTMRCCLERVWSLS